MTIKNIYGEDVDTRDIRNYDIREGIGIYEVYAIANFDPEYEALMAKFETRNEACRYIYGLITGMRQEAM